jgi:hypothetical protein
MNGVGCTLYEMFDQKGKHREGKNNRGAVTIPLVESTLLEERRKWKI